MTPRWWGTVLYPSALLLVFLGTQLLLGLLGMASNQRAALAALPTVAALLITLPIRLTRVWGSPAPWQQLGIRAGGTALWRALLRGLLKAMVLLLVVLIGLALAGSTTWAPRLSTGLLINGLALGLGVGFAEELLFRGWLQGELSLLVGPQRALLLQAAVFSLAHTRFNLPAPLLLSLLGGLLLLGLALGLQRRADNGVLWGAIGLHGGLVGGWFVLQTGVVSINPAAPAWLIGPANPIGGALGWLGLVALLMARRRWWPRPGGPTARQM